MAPRLKVLFLSPYLPFPPRSGGESRIYHLLRLSAEHHEVHLLTLTPARAPGVDRALAALGKLCAVTAIPARAHTLPRRIRTFGLSALPDMALRGQSPEFEQALCSLLEREPLDVVQAESIEMAQYGAAARTIRARRGIPLLCYDAFNAEYQLQRRAFFTDIGRMRSLPVAFYSLVQWQKLLRYERRLARRFDLVFAVSEVDRRTLATITRTPRRVEVVPNGVDTSYFAGSGRPAAEVVHRAGIQPPSILFTGTLDFRPNVDAVTWFVRNVWEPLHNRRPELRFRVVGQRPVGAVEELGTIAGVDVVGAVEDVRPWFAATRAYVLPMRIGGGVRLKLLEAWAMGAPCVTTSLGAEGVEGFQAGVHALVADEPAAFGRAVERLLDDHALAGRLAGAGSELAAAYDWRPIFGRMERAWCRWIEQTGSSSCERS